MKKPNAASRLLPYLRRHYPLVASSVLCLLVMNVAGVLQPYLLKVAVDTNILGGDYAGLLRTALIFGIVMLGSYLFEVLFNYAIQYLGQRLVLDLRVELFRKALSLPRSYYDRTPVGDVLTNLSNDVEAIREFISEGIVTAAGSIIRVLFIFAAMMLINVRLALVAFVTVPFFVLATALFRVGIRSGFREVRAANSAINVSLVETITGIREIHQLGHEAESRRGFDRSNRRYRDAYLRVVGAYALFFPVMELVASASMALVLLFSHFGLGVTVKVGDVFAFFSYLTMFFWPLRDLAEKFNTFQSALAATERVFRLQDQPVEIAGPLRPTSVSSSSPHSTSPRSPSEEARGEVRGEVRYESVSFSYTEGSPVLRDVSFIAAPGEKIALVGATGSGKTTITALLTRLYDVSSGKVRIDGVDVRDLSLKDLRTVVATVPQDTFIFTGTVAENISLGDPSVSRERVEEAARRVMADRYINRLPDGYDTEVLEEGKRLSVGERQLLGLARAMCREPRIVVLDEATANIDSETEKLLQEGIAGLLEGRTALIVAHRLSTVRSVDRILVMKDGVLAEQGTHAELVSRGGIYAGLYEMQSLMLGVR